MPEPPGPDDRLGLSLMALWSKVEGGYRGVHVGKGTGRWEWECTHEPHATRAEAMECARAEVRARRVRVSSQLLTSRACLTNTDELALACVAWDTGTARIDSTTNALQVRATHLR